MPEAFLFYHLPMLKFSNLDGREMQQGSPRVISRISYVTNNHLFLKLPLGQP